MTQTFGNLQGVLLPPIDERTDDLELLTFHRGKWVHVKWSTEHKAFSLGRGSPFISELGRLFLEIPPKPADADRFYSWRKNHYDGGQS